MLGWRRIGGAGAGGRRRPGIELGGKVTLRGPTVKACFPGENAGPATFPRAVRYHEQDRTPPRSGPVPWTEPRSSRDVMAIPPGRPLCPNDGGPPAAARRGRWGVWGLWVVLGAAILAGSATAAQRGKTRERVRARPPQPGRWDRATGSAFVDDAFATLEGTRPDFAAAAGARAAASSASAAGPGSTAGFKWSSLVSADTLADEVKEQRKALQGALVSESDFKGGGYNAARDAFSAVALAFGLVAAHDGEVRWKKDAENARDLFARVGFNCKVGTVGSFKESKERLADLETLLDGGSPDKKADREEDFLWSQVAGRPALMNRLEAAEAAAAATIASKSDFDRAAETLLREVEMVAAIGEVIQQKDFEYHDDDTYRRYSSAMRDAAVKARDAARKGDYDAARAAVGEVKKSCDTCHGDYRS